MLQTDQIRAKSRKRVSSRAFIRVSGTFFSLREFSLLHTTCAFTPKRGRLPNNPSCKQGVRGTSRGFSSLRRILFHLSLRPHTSLRHGIHTRVHEAFVVHPRGFSSLRRYLCYHSLVHILVRRELLLRYPNRLAGHAHGLKKKKKTWKKRNT